jgi:hypothetical protein
MHLSGSEPTGRQFPDYQGYARSSVLYLHSPGMSVERLDTNREIFANHENHRVTGPAEFAGA